MTAPSNTSAEQMYVTLGRRLTCGIALLIIIMLVGTAIAPSDGASAPVIAVRGTLLMMVLLCPSILCGRVAARIAARKEAAPQAYWWGFFLGPIGWIIALFLDGRAPCSACRERVNAGARVCPHCRSALTA